MTQQTILVVDDEAPMRKLVASNLKASGYDVHTATDGTEALKLIAERPPLAMLLADLSAEELRAVLLGLGRGWKLPANDIPVPDEAMLENARRSLDRFSFVGITEKFDQ